MIRYWEDLLGRYGRHPYLLVRYAIPLMVLCAGQALALLEEALEEMAARDAEIGAEFEAYIDDLRDRFDRKMIYGSPRLCCLCHGGFRRLMSMLKFEATGRCTFPKALSCFRSTCETLQLRLITSRACF
ncbi:hypothetical protein PENSPDRAFT_118404 [Peniophora sp. CONT]|nr:hypothetical protein PENSPDRAFT_118404 [Peniophora sp. CONT]